MDLNQVSERMVRAIKLDDSLFEEVEHDLSATSQAGLVVILSSIAAGVGTGIMSRIGIIGIFIGAAVALFAWYIWAYIVYFIGVKLMPEANTKSSPGELLRTIGFSSAPGIFRLFGFLPIFGGLIAFVSSVWMIVAMVKAVKAALDYTSTIRAIGVVLAGWFIQAAVVLIAIFMFGGFG